MTKETFIVAGAEANVVNARYLAWQGLRAVLASDNEEQWSLADITHEFVPADKSPTGDRPCVRFTATFSREPDEEEALV